VGAGFPKEKCDGKYPRAPDWRLLINHMNAGSPRPGNISHFFPDGRERELAVLVQHGAFYGRPRGSSRYVVAV